MRALSVIAFFIVLLRSFEAALLIALALGAILPCLRFSYDCYDVLVNKEPKSLKKTSRYLILASLSLFGVYFSFGFYDFSQGLATAIMVSLTGVCYTDATRFDCEGFS